MVVVRLLRGCSDESGTRIRKANIGGVMAHLRRRRDMAKKSPKFKDFHNA